MRINLKSARPWSFVRTLRQRPKTLHINLLAPHGVGDIARLFPRLGVDEIPQSIVQALNLWRNGVPLEDDLTVLALERKNPSDTYNNA